MADGYAVQKELVDLILADGDSIVGYKVGLTSKPMQKMIGVDSPDFAPILGSTAYGDGGAVSLATLIQPKMEAEVIAVMGSRLQGPGVNVTDAARAVAGVCASVEIVDSRFEDWRIRLADTVADLASNGAFAVSSRVVPLGEVDAASGGDDADSQRRAGRHRRRRRGPRRPARGGGLAGERARRAGHRPRARPPRDDRRAARRGAHGRRATSSGPTSTGSARSR